MESVLEAGINLSGGLWSYEIWGPFATWDRLEYIDSYVAKKMAAIAEHRRQVATIPYGEGVLGLNRWRAVFADHKASAPKGQYAEAFRRIAVLPRSIEESAGKPFRHRTKSMTRPSEASQVYLIPLGYVA